VKEAVLDTIRDHADGLRNSEIADLLDIRSDYLGKQKDFLSWSVLGLLMNDGLIKREGDRYLYLPQATTREL
jgi:hypothetical protein